MSAPHTRTEPFYRLLASTIDALKRCEQTGNEWASKHRAALISMERDILPSGSGLDSGCKLDLDRSTGERIVITTSYHHMNDAGMYDGWTDHTITVLPSLISRFDLRISGRNRREIKDYLHDVFHTILSEDVTQTYDPGTDTLSHRLARLINA